MWQVIWLNPNVPPDSNKVYINLKKKTKWQVFVTAVRSPFCAELTSIQI